MDSIRAVRSGFQFMGRPEAEQYANALDMCKENDTHAAHERHGAERGVKYAKMLIVKTFQMWT